jgi:hypothetical protein
MDEENLTQTIVIQIAAKEPGIVCGKNSLHFTIYHLVKEDAVKPEYFDQVRHMAWQARQKGLNIDYFPTNFVVCNELLYYVDYECNPYDPQWNFENWGNDYWWKSPAFLDYVNQHTDI